MRVGRRLLLRSLRGRGLPAGFVRSAGHGVHDARSMLQRALRARSRHGEPSVPRVLQANRRVVYACARLLLARVPWRRVRRCRLRQDRRRLRGRRGLLLRTMRREPLPARHRARVQAERRGLHIGRRRRVLRRVQSRATVRCRARRVPPERVAVHDDRRLLRRHVRARRHHRQGAAALYVGVHPGGWRVRRDRRLLRRRMQRRSPDVRPRDRRL
ncbi:MAG: hypothetical protein JWP87_3209 [Labilithrix sp.]|nr:hypothetical protein [Labilithrix sp.]